MPSASAITREQPSEDAVADDQIGREPRPRSRGRAVAASASRHRVGTERVVHRRRAARGHDHARGVAAEQAARVCVAVRARHEDVLADAVRRFGARIHNMPTDSYPGTSG